VINGHPSILIAHSDETLRERYRQLLAPLPAHILEARDGGEALRLAGEHGLALILLEVRLPGLDGGEAKRLRHGRNLQAPIILVAHSRGDADSARHGYCEGVVDCLNDAPADPGTLSRKAGVFVELYASRMAMRATIAQLEHEKELLHARCTQIQKGQKRAYYWATRDALTHLPNRAMFEERLELTMKLAARAHRRVAVGFMDLDGFKQVNDRYGHAAGDELLTRVSQRLQQAMRESDTVARLGGDEFALLLENLDASVAAEFLRDRVHRIVCAPLVLDATLGGAPAVVRPRASIGIALFPDHAGTREALLKQADASMYAAKRNGGGVRLCQGDGHPVFAGA